MPSSTTNGLLALGLKLWRQVRAEKCAAGAHRIALETFCTARAARIQTLIAIVLIAALSPLPATIQVGFPVLGRTSTNGNNTYANWTGSLTPGDCITIDANHNLADSGSPFCGGAGGQLHSISFVIDGGGSTILTGDAKVYPTAAFACTINRWDISADQSGSITVDVWKRAGAIPGSGNKISASAPLTLSTAQLAQNGSLTGWGTTVSSGDVFGFSVATVTTVTRVVGQIWCQ